MFGDLIDCALQMLSGGPREATLYRHYVFPIPTERLAAAGKIGDDNAPQTQRPEVDTRRLPHVQTP